MSNYKLYLDKSNNFQCKLELEGASLANAHTRLILEGRTKKFLFEGKIQDDGQCEINLDRLSEIFKSGDTGKIQLEVIADDAYFAPWESVYEMDVSKKVRVEVITPTQVLKKPQVTVQLQQPTQQEPQPIVESSKKISGKEKEFNKLVEYMQRKIHTTNTPIQKVHTDKKLFLERIETLVEKCTYKHNPQQVYNAILNLL